MERSDLLKFDPKLAVVFKSPHPKYDFGVYTGRIANVDGVLRQEVLVGNLGDAPNAFKTVWIEVPIFTTREQEDDGDGHDES